MILPRVSEILRGAGLVDTRWFTAEARDLGTAVHAAAHYLDEQDLLWSSVPPRVMPRLRQYQLFKEQVAPEILKIEEEVENVAFQYAGRLDRRLRIKGVEGILDLKGPSRSPWQAIQLAFYASCFDRPLKRWTLHLSDEKYQLIEHKNRRDWDVARAALVLAAFRGEVDGAPPPILRVHRL